MAGDGTAAGAQDQVAYASLWASVNTSDGGGCWIQNATGRVTVRDVTCKNSARGVLLEDCTRRRGAFTSSRRERPRIRDSSGFFNRRRRSGVYRLCCISMRCKMCSSQRPTYCRRPKDTGNGLYDRSELQLWHPALAQHRVRRDWMLSDKEQRACLQWDRG